MTYDSELYNPLNSYGATASAMTDSIGLPQTMLGGAVATVTDIGTTLWNSLTPDSMNVETEELLGRISSDALQVYNENPDTIKTLSFIGGMVLPIGAAFKGMDALRKGSKGANWFSTAGREQQLARAEKAFSEAGPASEAYIKAKWDMYRGVAYNALADNAVAEAAILLTMNAHPYLEDYPKDFLKNFTIGTLFGAGIQTGLGTILAKSDILARVAPIEKESTSILVNTLVKPEVEAGLRELSFMGEKVAIRAQNIENLQDIIAKAKSPDFPEYTLHPYTITTLERTAQREEALLYKTMIGASDGELAIFLEKAPAEAKAHILEFASRAENAGLDKMSYAKVKDSTTIGKGAGELTDTPSLFKRMLNAAGEERLVKTDAYYSPVWGKYFGKKDHVNYLTLADLNLSVKELEKSAVKEFQLYGRSDIGLELGVSPSAFIDAEYAKAYLAVKDMGWKELNKIKSIDPDDLPYLKAVHQRALELQQKGEIGSLSLRITKEAPSFRAMERTILRQKGMSPDYGDTLRKMEREWDSVSLFHPRKGSPSDVSRGLNYTVADWIRGNKDVLREGAEALIRGETTHPAAQKLTALIQHPRSIALRDMMQKQADEEGYVWLYRGLKREPGLHPALESYTILPDKAAEFIGKGSRQYEKGVKMFRVHVDDIVAGFRDIAEHGGSTYKPEILVMAPVRKHAQVDLANLHAIPKEITIGEAALNKIEAAIPSAELTSLEGLMQQMQASTLASIKTLQAQGYGMEAIALRTGTPVETVKQIILSGYVPPAGLIKYGSAADVEMAMAQTNRSLALSTSTKKVNVKSQLDSMGMDKMSEDFAQWALLTSPSAIAQEVGKRFLNSDMKNLMKQVSNNLQELTDTQLKSTLFTSANQVLDAAGDLGPLATYIGKEAISLRNWVKEQFETPISTSMAAIARDMPAMMEWNTAMNLHASASGVRFYKDRKFWQFAEGSKLTRQEQQAIMGMDEVEFRTLLGSAEEGEEAAVKAIQYGDRDFSVVSASVDTALKQMQDYGAHLYELNNAYSKSVGRGSLPNIGFWRPTVNLASKEIAYSYNIVTKRTTLLYANTPKELVELTSEYTKHLQKTLDPQAFANTKIIQKSDQEYFNLLAGRHDPMTMEMADLSKFHSGASATALVKTDASLMQEVLSGYDFYLGRSVDNLLSIQMAPILDHLKRVSDIYALGYNANKANVIMKHINKPKDPGMVLKNVLLGYPNLSQHKTWAEWQQRLEIGTDMLIRTTSEILSPVLGPVTNKVFGKRPRTEAEWLDIGNQMKARGIFDPFEGVDKALGLGQFLREGRGEFVKPTAKAIVLSNALAGTMLLKFIELGQPLVNAVSLPILTSAAVSRKMKSSFMGATLDPNAKFTLAQVMSDGVQLMHAPHGDKWMRAGEAKGWFSSELRNVTELQAHVRSVTPGAMSTLEAGLESKLVNTFSTASNWSEEMVRKASFGMGVVIAKKAYKGLDDTGVMVYARDFMDRVVGNYTAAQRPAMFQGTFGVSLGLFQTYMLTMAQAMYKQVAAREWKSLGKMMLTQSTIFGASSLPGFHLVSEAIAENFSDRNFDLETGLFRAVEDNTANVLLYGLPTMLGPGITTRGDIQPRVPNPFQGLSSVAAVNMSMQVYNSMERIAQAAFTVDENAGLALLEAISLQSVSRPLARVSELAMGASFTGAGNVVASNEEIWNTQSIMARLFATRPLSEVKLRQAMEKDTLYNAADRDKRQGVVKRLKTHIRTGELDSEVLSGYAEQYMRTGTPSGWNSAVNEALTQDAYIGSETVRRKLGPDNPLNFMIDEM